MTSTTTTTSATALIASANRRTRRTRLVACTALGALALVGLAACGSGQADGADVAGIAATIPAVGSDAVVDPSLIADPVNDPTPDGPGSGGHGAPLPVIDSFDTPEDIDCHNGNVQSFTASWTTTNATHVTISIDGPGIFDEYDADGDASLPFNCSSSHSFLLTAYNSDGASATRHVVLEPRNVPSVRQPLAGDEEQDSGEDEGQPLDLRRVPSGSTAKVSGGSTGQGPADDTQCEAFADAINELDDQAVNADSEAEMDAAVGTANAMEDTASALGCFFVYA
jgi:hypothetical protein